MFSENFESHFDYKDDEIGEKGDGFFGKKDEKGNERIQDYKKYLMNGKPFTKEHPQNDSNEAPITDGKLAIKAIWESLIGEGYESKISFSTKGKNGEDINVEYKKDGTLHTSIQVNNENLEITLSGFEKQEGENNQKEKNESPINVSYSGNMSAKNLQNLFGNKNINSIQDLSNQQRINLVKGIQRHEIQNLHGTADNTNKMHNYERKTQEEERNKLIAEQNEGQKEKEELKKIHEEEAIVEQETQQKLAELEKEINESYMVSIGTESGIEQPKA